LGFLLLSHETVSSNGMASSYKLVSHSVFAQAYLITFDFKTIASASAWGLVMGTCWSGRVFGEPGDGIRAA